MYEVYRVFIYVLFFYDGNRDMLE